MAIQLVEWARVVMEGADTIDIERGVVLRPNHETGYWEARPDDTYTIRINGGAREHRLSSPPKGT